MSMYVCEQEYVQDYVRNLLQRAGLQRTKAMASPVWAIGSGGAVLSTGIPLLYGVPGSDGSWRTSSILASVNASSFFVGSLTVAVALDLYTSGDPRVTLNLVQMYGGSSIRLGTIWREVFTAGAESSPRKSLNIPFCVFNAIALGNTDGSSDAIFDCKFDGWLVNVQ